MIRFPAQHLRLPLMSALHPLGLSSCNPHLHQDWACPSHIRAGTGPTPSNISASK